mmetsp:Transcript_23541/g.79511  ORF Transcript_23541/g.79511 Transcript_23541/m.79511 type:complete len:315 (+) Transcript_23541:238-1182(+)
MDTVTPLKITAASSAVSLPDQQPGPQVSPSAQWSEESCSRSGERPARPAAHLQRTPRRRRRRPRHQRLAVARCRRLPLPTLGHRQLHPDVSHMRRVSPPRVSLYSMLGCELKKARSAPAASSSTHAVLYSLWFKREPCHSGQRSELLHRRRELVVGGAVRRRATARRLGGRGGLLRLSGCHGGRLPLWLRERSLGLEGGRGDGDRPRPRHCRPLHADRCRHHLRAQAGRQRLALRRQLRALLRLADQLGIALGMLRWLRRRLHLHLALHLLLRLLLLRLRRRRLLHLQVWRRRLHRPPPRVPSVARRRETCSCS